MKAKTHLLELIFLTIIVAVLGANSHAAAAEPSLDHQETKAERDARMAWWREAKFGLFIHWGLYSHLGGEWDGKSVGGYGEWIMHTARIPISDYLKAARDWNPTNFNADEWVALAKAAGVKYIVFTAKHHDGFAMFHSKVSPINIYDATPFKRDPVKELSEACQKQGIKFGVYYSQAQDWTHPGGAAREHSDGVAYWDPAQKGAPANPPVKDAYGRPSSAIMDEYLDKVAVPQVRELLSNYGTISVLWFDTAVGITHERALKFLPLLKLQPGIIINNRLVDGDPLIPGDFDTPEQYIPAQGYPGHDWETCMTMNDTWGYKSNDHNWKSTETIIRNLVDIASKGGNFLLNIGPDGTGMIPAASVERLRAIGAWMKVNGQAIYGTTATPFGAEAGAFSPTEKDGDGKPLFKPEWKWRATKKPGHIYLIIFAWPTAGHFEIPSLPRKIKKATLLADPSTKLTVNQDARGIIVGGLPASAPDHIASVIDLTY